MAIFPVWKNRKPTFQDREQGKPPQHLGSLVFQLDVHLSNDLKESLLAVSFGWNYVLCLRPQITLTGSAIGNRRVLDHLHLLWKHKLSNCMYCVDHHIYENIPELTKTQVLCSKEVQLSLFVNINQIINYSDTESFKWAILILKCLFT